MENIVFTNTNFEELLSSHRTLTFSSCEAKEEKKVCIWPNPLSISKGIRNAPNGERVTDFNSYSISATSARNEDEYVKLIVVETRPPFSRKTFELRQSI